jgi:hypothetical protein
MTEKPTDCGAWNFAMALISLAESRPPQPITAGPPELPDLVHTMVKLAHATPGFAQQAMLGEITASQWRTFGAFHADIGRLCDQLASTLDKRR